MAKRYCSKAVTLIHDVQVEAEPATLQFVPAGIIPTLSRWFVVGTYKLRMKKKPGDFQAYHGRIKLCRLQPGSSVLKEVDIYLYPSAGVYFLRFFYEKNILLVGTTAGYISVFRIGQNTALEFEIQHIVDHHLFDDKNTTITSFSWLSSQGLPTLAVTSNSLNDAGKGATTLVRFTNDQHLEVSAISKDGLIPIHEGYGLPVPVYSSCWSGCTLFTGGDDGSLRMSNFVYLLNTSWAAMELYQPREFKNYHEGGLLSILSCDDFELAAASSKSLPTLDHVHILLTGGYDDYFRVNSIDKTGEKKPKVLAELKIGNGVYSLRLMKGWKEVKAEEDTFQRLLVLASCCLGGVKVIEILYNRQEDAWTLEIIASMTHHKSLCYASDSVDMGDGSFLIVSSSFYNKQLCVWRFTDPGVPRSENGWVDGTGYGYGTSVTRPDDTQMTEYDYDYEEDKPDTLIKEI